MVDFHRINALHRAKMRASKDSTEQRKAMILDQLDTTECEVQDMDDVLFVQKLLYYRENSGSPEHLSPIKRGEPMSYESVLHLIMYPELFKRLPLMVGSAFQTHHFLCKERKCDHRCRWQENA